MKTFFYVLTVIGGVIGALILFGSLFVDSAPQQGAGAAMAVAFVVIPYCMGRATEKIGQKPLTETLAQLLIAHSQSPRPTQQSALPSTPPPVPPIAHAPARNPFAPNRM